MSGTWRDSAKAHLEEVIKDNPNADEKTLKKLFRDAYPFGERAMHPYKIWCDQVNKTLATLFPNGHSKEKLSLKKYLKEKNSEVMKNQTKIEF